MIVVRLYRIKGTFSTAPLVPLITFGTFNYLEIVGSEDVLKKSVEYLEQCGL